MINYSETFSEQVNLSDEIVKFDKSDFWML